MAMFTEVETHFVGRAIRPFLFVQVWDQLVTNTDADAIKEHVNGLTSGLGVIASLFMGFLWAASGHDLTVHPNNIWGERVYMAQDAYTGVTALTTMLCFMVVVNTTRVFMDLSLTPDPLAKATTARMGGHTLVDLPFMQFAAISVLTMFAVMLYSTIITPHLLGMIFLGVETVLSIICISRLLLTDAAVVAVHNFAYRKFRQA